LRLVGAGLAAAAMRRVETARADTLFFGRPTNPVSVYDVPHYQGKVVARKRFDEIVEVIGQAEGGGMYPHNNIWDQIPEGWVYSSFIQPAQWIVNTPTLDIGAGKWGEISIPIALGSAAPGANGFKKLYYSEVYRVVRAQPDAAGKIWYGLAADNGATVWRWLPGDQVRIIAPEELAPISPDVTNKLVVVDRPSQTVIAYENGNAVFSARTSTGTRWASGDYFTPPGNWNGLEKRMSKYMTGGRGSDAYGVTGVGYVYYFTQSKAATHSTYWHNNYGTPMSHGCVNLRPDDAKWIWRWTHPVIGYDTITVLRNQAPDAPWTPVKVV
jgi:lipoprotein-anchoring transpeptidase ErfK/SrfK